jgi:formamidopyrimidine-DNA glycosylase
MLEFVEARVIAEQLNRILSQKVVKRVVAGSSPHKFAFFHDDKDKYDDLLKGKTVTAAEPNGGQIEMILEDMRLVFGDGVSLRYHEKNDKIPSKHQLLVEFEDAGTLSASVQMYGCIWCFKAGEYDNPYYQVAKEKPSPLSEEFDYHYFDEILSAPGALKLSAKAILATEQRIPGLGNGVLQDILYNAGIHPKRKVQTMVEEDKKRLFLSVKSTLKDMVNLGGRDTEKDLFGVSGGYRTKLSKNTVDKPCPVCKSLIRKEAYLGGSIYYCEGCQH